MKFIANHRLHFRSGNRQLVIIEQSGAQEIPDWALNDPLFSAALSVGFIRRAESEPDATLQPAPVAETRARRRAK